MAKSSPPAGTINPYVDILQLDPLDCPPDHYVLLGLQRFTSDASQIEAAANEQIKYVRPFCARYPSEGTQLLNELTKAKLCLLDDDERAAYDAQLRQNEAADTEDSAEETDSFAADFGDELDVMAETKADNRIRRCPHCGSGLFETEKTCRACAGGLAAGGPWMIAKCPECTRPISRGAVVCKKCNADLSITDVIGCVPSHVPGSIRPFECQQRKKLRSARHRAMLAWAQEGDLRVPADGDPLEEESSKPSPETSEKKNRTPVDESLPPLLIHLINAINLVREQMGIEGDITETAVRQYRQALAWMHGGIGAAEDAAESVPSRYRQTMAWMSAHGVAPKTLVLYLFVAAIPLLGFWGILKFINSDTMAGLFETSHVATTTPHTEPKTPPSAPAGRHPNESVAGDTPPNRQPGGAAEAAAADMSEDSKPPEPAKTEGQKRLQALVAKAAEVSSGDKLESVEDIRDVLALIHSAKSLETWFDDDAASNSELKQLKQALIDQAITGLRSRLVTLRSTKKPGDPQYQQTLRLLNDSDTRVLQGSRNWGRVEDVVERFVYEDAQQTLVHLYANEMLDEAAGYADSAKAPLVITNYTEQLRLSLNKKSEELYGLRLRIQMGQLGKSLNIEEGLAELARINTGDASPNLSRNYEECFGAFVQAVVKKLQDKKSQVNPVALQSIVDMAEDRKQPRNIRGVEELKSYLRSIEEHDKFLAKLAIIKDNNDADELLKVERPGQRLELKEVVRRFSVHRDRSNVERDSCWFVVHCRYRVGHDKLGRTIDRYEKFNNLYQAAAAVVWKNDLSTKTFSGQVCKTEDEADELIRNRGRLERLKYPLRPPNKTSRSKKIRPR